MKEQAVLDVNMAPAAVHKNDIHHSMKLSTSIWLSAIRRTNPDNKGNLYVNATLRNRSSLYCLM